MYNVGNGVNRVERVDRVEGRRQMENVKCRKRKMVPMRECVATWVAALRGLRRSGGCVAPRRNDVERNKSAYSVASHGSVAERRNPLKMTWRAARNGETFRLAISAATCWMWGASNLLRGGRSWKLHHLGACNRRILQNAAGLSGTGSVRFFREERISV